MREICFSNVTIADLSTETITDVGLDFSEAGYRNKPEFSVLNLPIPDPLCKFLSETTTLKFKFQVREDKTVSLSV